MISRVRGPLYDSPKTLRDWSEVPERGKFVPEAQVWSHEIDFWGGDLKSLKRKLDYINDLGVDVLYLNPIHKAYTNHKYDAQDYFAVSPEYGDRNDVKALAQDLHKRGMKLVLDGVFNHVGRTSPWFQEALEDPTSPYRDWFFIGPQYDMGYRGWVKVANLPELRMENPEVQAMVFADPDSVVQGYLRDGVDGWRLDVAPELGFNILQKLTEAAHKAKPGSLVVGENWVYPEEWSPSLDAVMNFHFWKIIMSLVEGKLSGAHAGRMIDQCIEDTGLDPILKAWIVLDNHDVSRLRNQLPELWQQRLAQILQFTLPGSPCVYYGVELGMEGGDDPCQRAPMRWDLVNNNNEYLKWMRRLLAIRRENRALKIGDFRLLDSDVLLAFMRRTDHVAETVVVLVNPTDKPVSDIVPVRDSKLMNWQQMRDQLSDAKAKIFCGVMEVTIPAHTARVFMPIISGSIEYDAYKRVQ